MLLVDIVPVHMEQQTSPLDAYISNRKDEQQYSYSSSDRISSCVPPHAITDLRPAKLTEKEHFNTLSPLIWPSCLGSRILDFKGMRLWSKFCPIQET